MRYQQTMSILRPGLTALLVGSALALSGATAFAAQANTSQVDAETYRKLDQLMDVFERVRAEYVDKVDDKKLLEGAINGMIASLDPHSSYMDEKETKNFRTVTDGEFGGLGLEVTLEEGVVKVISAIDNTPAAKAGIRGGDFITQINKEPVFGLDLNDAVEKMRGTPKTQVTLTIVRRNGDKIDKPFDITLTREIIQQAQVRFELKPGGVAYIRLPQFHKKAADQIRSAITSLQKQSAGNTINGYILDLRSNPGGLLDQAVEISDMFLERGEIVSQRGRKKTDIQRYFAHSGDLLAGKPMVVLVNEASASASEIVAGALQDQRRAIIVGRRTFGKGSVQTLIPLGPDTALRLTTARYYTPSGRSVQEQGIEPDVDVAQLTNDQKPGEIAPTFLNEADLGRHLSNEKKEGAHLEERDTKADPRQLISVDQLKKQGITDFQLDYAVRLLSRLGSTRVAVNQSKGLQR